MNFPLVSVIITTKNEEKNIRRCLESISRQKYPKDRIEIIVIDNNSADKTKKIAGEHIQYIYNLPPLAKQSRIKNYRGAQLNFGVKKAKGEIIFFPDADMTFDANLIKEAVRLTENYDALYVPEIVKGRGFFGKVRNFERSFYHATCIDAVRIVKKKVYLKAGGFDEKINFGPDDWDFTKTLKKYHFGLGITKKPLFHHEERNTFKIYIQKKSKYTNNFRNYINKWGGDDPDVKKQFGFRYRFFEVFLEKGKWRRLVRSPVLTLGIYLLRFCIGCIFIKNKICKKY